MELKVEVVQLKKQMKLQLLYEIICILVVCVFFKVVYVQ